MKHPVQVPVVPALLLLTTMLRRPRVAFPASVIFLMALGILEEDLAVILVAYLGGLVNVAFFGGLLALPVTDTLKQADDDGRCARTLPREKLWRIRAGEVILAQGAIERPLVFEGNDTPGVMLASSAKVCDFHGATRLRERFFILIANVDSAGWDALCPDGRAIF